MQKDNMLIFKNKLFLVFKKIHCMIKPPKLYPNTSPVEFDFLSSNLLPFYIRNHTRNSSLCFHENDSVNSRSQISLISFLDYIRYSMQIMLLCEIEIVQRYLLLVYSISLIKTIHLLLYRLKGLTQ